jgi:predicted metalloendopeptidase
MILGRLYYETVMPGRSRMSNYIMTTLIQSVAQTKADIPVITDNIQAAFLDRMKDPNITPWMSDESRQAAVKKLSSVSEYLLIPPDLAKPSFIATMMSSLKIEQLKNQTILAASYAVVRYWNLIQTQNFLKDPGNFYLNAFNDWTEANAYYMHEFNAMVLPMGLLHPLFISTKSSLATTYGIIGSILGHEYTHGFDIFGVQYDDNGSNDPIFDSTTENAFEKNSKCFIDYYSKFKSLQRQVNGSQTLGENMADQGGLLVGWDAYKKVASQDRSIPGFTDFKPDHLFWLGFAQVFCQSIVDDQSLAIQV